MSVDIASVWNIALDWMAHGLWQLSWWQLLLYALVTTHVTIAGVTIFLHRCQAHRSLDLGPVPSHSSGSGCGWARAWSPRSG